MLIWQKKFGFYVKCIHTLCIWKQYTTIKPQFLWQFKMSTIRETISNFRKEKLLNSSACVMDTNTKSQKESLADRLRLWTMVSYYCGHSRCFFSKFLGWVNLALTQSNESRKIPTFITTITKKLKRDRSVEDKIRTSYLGPVNVNTMTLYGLWPSSINLADRIKVKDLQMGQLSFPVIAHILDCFQLL